ncbi:MAG: FHA domain-containing protein [Flavisolibacter sp.]
MFDLFKRQAGEQPADAKTVREQLLQAIKEQLKKAEGGEGAHIRGLQVFITCTPEQRHMYEAAVYFGEPGRFREAEVQRIADDYAIDLPEGWTLDISFEPTLPAEAIGVPGLAAGFFIVTKEHTVQKTAVAYIKIRMGEAEKPLYTITSGSGKICIGRERRVQTAGGFYRENQIAFPANSENGSNRYVSRQHAHIEFDQASGQFLLFADEGGIPPGNKIKVKRSGEAEPLKLYTTSFAHALQEGDQVLLGESALLEFSYKQDEKDY